MEHVWTPKFQHHYPCSNPGPLASETSALATKLPCLTFEEKLPVRRVLLQFGVPTSFLQDRVMGNINADTAKSGPAPLFSFEEEDHS